MGLQYSIGVVVERRYRDQLQPAGLVNALEARGHNIEMIDSERTSAVIGDEGWLRGLDLVVARGRSWSLLCLLALAEIRGVRTVNTKASIGWVHNKAEMSVRLATAGLPIPRTYIGTLGQLQRQIPTADYPVIVKPIFGDNCRGLRLAETPAHLVDAWTEPVMLAQPFLATVSARGYDLKLYGIGDAVWAVRKPSCLGHTVDDAGDAEPLVATSELTALGRRCGRLFGLELFGVDCVETAQGPVVIEVNDFPNFTAVPNGNERLADYVLACVADGPRSGLALGGASESGA